MSISSRPRVLVLGSGWGSFSFLRKIDKSLFDVRVISPANHFLFTPLLPSTALGTVEFRAIQEPIRAHLHGGYYQAKARNVDFERRVVECEDIFHKDRFTLSYDLLLIAVGSKTNTFNTPGIQDREGREVYFLKHLYHARQIRNRILECFERAAIHLTEPEERDRLLSFLVVGGGPTSVEFVGELNDFLKEDVSRFYPELKPHIKVTLVEAGGNLLGNFDRSLVDYVQKRFVSEKINVKLKTSVTGLINNGRTATFSDGTSIQVGMVVWSAGLAPVTFTEALSSEIKRAPGSKRILVDDRLRVDSPICKGRVYAIGDAAVNTAVPLAPIAQVARTQGLYLANVLNTAAKKHDLTNVSADDKQVEHALTEAAKEPYTFVSWGTMATLGGWKGVVDFTQIGSAGNKKNLGWLTGLLSFVIWRTAYLGRQVSAQNKLLIPVYWLKTWIFGRDVSRF